MSIIFKRKSIFTSFISAVIIVLFLGYAYHLSAVNYDSWSLSKKEVIKNNVPADGKYTEFTPVSKPKYKNKIMNYILALDKNLENDISFSTAIGLFNSAINAVLLIGVNWISRRVSENSLW